MRNFQEGDKILLEVSTDQASGRFRSRVLGSYDSGVVISAPLRKGQPIEGHSGLELKGVVIREDATYSFETTVLFTEEAEYGASWYLAPPERLTRIQRRYDVRLEVTLPVEVHVTKRDKDREVLKRITGQTINLSAGGAKIRTEERLPGDKAKVTFFLPGEKITVLASILRDGPVIAIRPEDKTTKASYWTALRLLAATEEEKLKIIKYIFHKQKELRAKGLI